MKTILARCTLTLVLAVCACSGFGCYRLVSENYGFSVQFPDKPAEQTKTNYQGLPENLWTLERDSSQEFFSAEATTYREPLDPAPNWIPNRENLAVPFML